jgi:sulfite reductase (NADPH) flavoprotein alpha-component
MARCDVEILKRQRYLLVITSTHGNGEPPETAAPFWEAFAHASHLDLRNVRFSVLALGNSPYDYFCQCGRNFDATLERHGATRFHPRVECDAEYELPSRPWINGVLNSLKDEHRASAVA